MLEGLGNHTRLRTPYHQFVSYSHSPVHRTSLLTFNDPLTAVPRCFIGAQRTPLRRGAPPVPALVPPFCSWAKRTSTTATPHITPHHPNSLYPHLCGGEDRPPLRARTPHLHGGVRQRDHPPHFFLGHWRRRRVDGRRQGRAALVQRDPRSGRLQAGKLRACA